MLWKKGYNVHLEHRGWYDEFNAGWTQFSGTQTVDKRSELTKFYTWTAKEETYFCRLKENQHTNLQVHMQKPMIKEKTG
jgi:hypothetical protein